MQIVKLSSLRGVIFVAGRHSPMVQIVVKNKGGLTVVGRSLNAAVLAIWVVAVAVGVVRDIDHAPGFCRLL